MSRNRHARLAPESTGPEVCPTHRLVKYPKIVAQLDAEKMRREAAAGSPQSVAHAEKCANSSGDVWHVFVPTKGRMQTIRRKLREQGLLPPVDQK